MTLQTWMADELRAAGLRVVEVSGWKTRGTKVDADTYKRFDPIGVTWHATAGSRTSTAQGEVNVLLNGSTSAPPPIAQLMIYRDGTVYVVAAGRCNHNLVGWAGPNEGLGNGDLFGIEMANDNRGEPWPAVQLDAARRTTVVLMRHIKADPMKRLAAHYEHQPYPPPAGQTSTKTDPHGVRMTDERPRVAAMMEEDTLTPEEVWNADIIPAPEGSKSPDGTPNVNWSPASYLRWGYKAQVEAAAAAKAALAAVKMLAAQDNVDEQAVAAAVAPIVAQAVLAALPQNVEGMTSDELGQAIQAGVQSGMRAVFADAAA